MDKCPTSLPTACNEHERVVFRCHVDRRQYVLPAVMCCVFAVVILAGSPDILWGFFGVLFGALPMAALLIISRSLWSRVTYVVDGHVLLLSSPLRSLDIDIGSITGIRRGKFWIERNRNYSASYIKLRITYGKYRYVYVSPDDEEAFVRVLQSINPDIVYSSERNL